MKMEVKRKVKYVIIDGKVYEVKVDKDGKRYIELPDEKKSEEKEGKKKKG